MEIPNPEDADGSKQLEQVIKELTSAHLKRSGKSVSSDMIEVEIVSQTVPDLTLIDLPGLITVSPDNELNLMEDIHDLVMQNATERDCILVVGDAGRDLPTIVGFKEAKMKDPDQERTLAALTKVDKYIRDTVVLEKMATSLSNRGVIKLKHGFVGLKNRLEDEREKTIEECEEIEKTIMSHLKQHIPTGRQTLITKLKSIQNAHLKDSLPKQKELLKKELENVKQMLHQFSINVEAKRNGKSGLKDIHQKIVDELHSAVEHFSTGIGSSMTSTTEEEAFEMLKTRQQPLSLSTFTTYVEDMKRKMIAATTMDLSGNNDYFELVWNELDTQKGYPGLPDLYQPILILKLCGMKWIRIEDSVEDLVNEMCVKFKQHLLHSILPKFTMRVIDNAKILNLLASTLEEHLQTKIEKLHRRFARLFTLERQRTFTTNDYYTNPLSRNVQIHEILKVSRNTRGSSQRHSFSRNHSIPRQYFT